MISRGESDKKKAHADISMKLGKNVHEHEKFEYLFLAIRNWPIFKMAVLNPRWPPQKTVKSENEDFTRYKVIKKHLKWYNWMKYIMK